MSNENSDDAAGGIFPAERATALVIDKDVERHIGLRRALRRCGLFGLILSAESGYAAQDILTDPETPPLSLILVSEPLRAEVIAAANAAQTSKIASIRSTASNGSVFPTLRIPVGPGDIEALMKKLD